MTNDPDMSGVLIVDKPAGQTSNAVVGAVRRWYGTKKVGHAGTLDPMATGVLIVGLNRATRLLGFLMTTEKAYAATIRLGISTVSDDAEGDPVSSPGAAGIDEARVRSALPHFTGHIEQVPTAVSAIKVDGRRAYDRVRAGEQVDLAARQVQVSDFELIDLVPRMVNGIAVVDCRVRVRCSSGTYVRALARDLGHRLGSAGHLTALRRTRVGAFGVDQAVRLDPKQPVPPLIGLAAAARSCLPTVELTAQQAGDVRHGRAIELALADRSALLYAGDLLAVYRPDGLTARAMAVFVSGQ